MFHGKFSAEVAKCCHVLSKSSLSMLILPLTVWSSRTCLALCCQDPTLEELYISATTVSGPIPDAVVEGSALRVFFAISRLQEGGITGGGGGGGEGGRAGGARGGGG
jgi:uncharacterized membrane protein YgcG